MKNDDVKRYLVQLRDILNHLIAHPKDANIQKYPEDMANRKNEIHIYLIPLVLDAGFEEFLAQSEEGEEGSKVTEDAALPEEELKSEITSFDKAFMRKWGFRF